MIEPQMINPYTYCFTTEVPYYQCDLSGKMKLSWLLKVMERAAGEHLEHIGLSYDRLYQEGIVFLLSKAAVRIHQCPTAADLLWVETAPQGVRGPSTTGRFASTGRKMAARGNCWLRYTLSGLWPIQWNARSCARTSSSMRCPPFRQRRPWSPLPQPGSALQGSPAANRFLPSSTAIWM